jgi:primosomal protein N'
MIARIAVSAANFAIDKPYSYRVPFGMTVLPGMRVQVRFGRGNRQAEGIVLSAEEGSEEGLKPIELCLDEEPLLDDTMLRLAAFMRERYFCTLFDAVRVMLPAGLWFDTKNVIRLTEDTSWEEKNLRNKVAAQILTFLQDLGGRAEELPEELIIHGQPALSGGIVDGANDHRIVMAAAIAASSCTAPVTILGAAAVNKSYPGFWDDYRHLGGDVHVL